MDRVHAIKELVDRGEYQVDTTAVAEAILRRLGLPGGPPAPGHGAQNACSYPASGRP